MNKSNYTYDTQIIACQSIVNLQPTIQYILWDKKQ